MFPDQDIPTLQLSLSTSYELHQHVQLAKELGRLRKSGVLIMTSGNIVHNLRKIAWAEDAKPQDWALEFEDFVLKTLKDSSISLEKKLDIIFSSKLTPLAHPSIDHLVPLIYALAAADEKSEPEVKIKGIQNASISMATIQFSKNT